LKSSSIHPASESISADSEAPQTAPAHGVQDLPTHAIPSAPLLSPRWLTISLIAITLIPVTLAATVWYAVPSSPEPELPVEVFFEPVSWPPNGKDEVRLMPGIRLHNPTHDQWRNVSLAINRQYYFYCPEPIEPGSDFSVPLAFFKTSGNQNYRPTTQHIKKLTIYAQQPSGRRAIGEFIEPQE